MDQHHSIHIPHHHDGSNSIWRAWHSTLLAIGRLDAQSYWWFHANHMACWQDIQNRHFDVREKSYLERNDYLDFQKKLVKTFNV